MKLAYPREMKPQLCCLKQMHACSHPQGFDRIEIPAVGQTIVILHRLCDIPESSTIRLQINNIADLQQQPLCVEWIVARLSSDEGGWHG